LPTYNYEGYECGHTFEVFQRMADEPISVCPSCGKKTRRVILSCPNFQMNNILTVGQQADYNWKKMGHYEKQEKAEMDGVNASLKRHKINKENQKIARLTGEQKKKYIEKGELP